MEEECARMDKESEQEAEKKDNKGAMSGEGIGVDTKMFHRSKRSMISCGALVVRIFNV